MKKLKPFIFGGIIGALVGAWVGANLAKNQPVWSNPFAETDVSETIREKSGRALEKSGRALERQGESLQRKDKPQ